VKGYVFAVVILATVAAATVQASAQMALSQPWIASSSTVSRDSFQSGLGATGAADLPFGSDFGLGGNTGVLPAAGVVLGADYDLGQLYNTDGVADARYTLSVLCASIGGVGRRILVHSARNDVEASALVLTAFSDVPRGTVVTEADLARVDRRCYQDAPGSVVGAPDAEALARKSDPIGALIAALGVRAPMQTP
jgi:hypothetical protein